MTTTANIVACIHYNATLIAAHIAAPMMRATGLRFSKASRDSKLINFIIARVPANLIADRLPVGKVKFF